MDEQIKGKWLGVVKAPGDLTAVDDGMGAYGVHAALLRTGRVVIWSGRVESSGYLYRSWSCDPTEFSEGDGAIPEVTGRWFLSDFDVGGPNESPPVPRWSDEDTIDLFCSHHVNLEDGRLLVVGGAGGQAEGDARGNPAIYTYDPHAERWSKADHELLRGRWYPTPVTLADGRVVVLSGRERGSSAPEESVEVLGAPDLRPALVSGADRKLYIYPGAVLVRGGRIFNVPTTWLIEDSPATAITNINPTAALRFTSRTSADWDTFPDPDEPGSDVSPINPYREEGTFVLLPPAQAGRILVIGGGYAVDPLGDSEQRPEARPGHCEILETQGEPPRWIEAGTLHHSRVNVHAVLLPNGKVLILGGHSSVKRNPDHEDRLIAEIYDPTVPFDPADASAAFTEAAEMGTSRNYHGTALLLPDGRVFVAGGEDNPHFGGNQTSVEIYEPPYCHQGERPVIAGLSVPDAPDDELAYGGAINVTCASAEHAASIADVVLMRPGSATHHTDTEQRHVPLNFHYLGGDTIRATAPIDPTVSPPGYYMLFVVDAQGRPCERAVFVRLSARRCLLVTDRSTFGLEEVQALPSRTIADAVYVHLDGFLPAELGVTTPTPSRELIAAWAPDVTPLAGDIVVESITLLPIEMLLEDPALPVDQRQRVTFRYSIRFDDLEVFPPESGPDRVTLMLRSSRSGWACHGEIDLTRQPSPYMLDGATHWLSTDVRVFQIRDGESRFGHTVDASNPVRFLRDVLSDFDADSTLAAHPFESLTTDQSESALQLAETDGGTAVLNFAICRVRYRALTLDANQVRMHFRMFATEATNLDWSPATYARETVAGSSIATPGVAGTEIVTIPFFGSPRVDPTTTSLSEQQDETNQKTIAPMASGAESRRYFGAFLDINRPQSRLPKAISPGDVGPFPAAEVEPIVDRIRGRHQCIVAEVDFPGDPIQPPANPANNDKLSQRNLAIEGSDNPGGPEAHTVALTFDVAPTWAVDWGLKRADIPPLDQTRVPMTVAAHDVHGEDDDAENSAEADDEAQTGENGGAAAGEHAHAAGAIDPILAHMPEHIPQSELVRGRLALGDLRLNRTALLRRDPVGARFAPMTHEHRPPPEFSWFQPDELMIEWGNLPRSTVATLFLPGVDAEHVVHAARLRNPWPTFDAVDQHTLRLRVGGLSHVPLPLIQRDRLAGLLTLELPDSVRVGQRFEVIVRQASNIGRRIVGTFQLGIPVAEGPDLAIAEARWYAVLQHIVAALDAQDRWHPVLERLLGTVKARVSGFGLDPGGIDPSLDPDDIVEPCPCCGRRHPPGKGARPAARGDHGPDADPRDGSCVDGLGAAKPEPCGTSDDSAGAADPCAGGDHCGTGVTIVVKPCRHA